jgi:hypothetical protein
VRVTLHVICRGFLPWRLSDDGPGASRIVAMGRDPKPFTTTDVCTDRNLLRSHDRLARLRRDGFESQNLRPRKVIEAD